MLAFLGSLLLVALVTDAQRPEPCGKYVLSAIFNAFHYIQIFFSLSFFLIAALHVKFIRAQ